MRGRAAVARSLPTVKGFLARPPGCSYLSLHGFAAPPRARQAESLVDRVGPSRFREDDTGGMSERVVFTRRIAKVVKGGRRLRFNALVVVGDGQGQVGAGLGKALVIPDAVRKGNAIARRGMITIPLRGNTIPQQITVKKGATIVIIKPAREGTGIIAAGAMRAMLELGGVKDVVGKTLGSRNPINIVYATMEALRQLKDPDVERARRAAAVAPASGGRQPNRQS